MTKEQKINELKQYIDTLKEYTQLKKRYDKLIENGDGIKAQVITDMPVSHSMDDKMCANVCEIQGLGELIQKRINKLYSTLLITEMSIATLTKSKHRIVLTLAYIDGLTWPRIAVEMNYSMQHLRRIHDKAIDLIEIIDIDDYRVAQ